MTEVSTSRVGSLAERTAQLAVELRVSDLTRSVDFYQWAGFRLERRTETFAALELDGRYLLLSATVGASAGPTPPNLRIVVADIDVTYARARERGLGVKHAPADRGYGMRDFTIEDPDGYEVRFAAPS